MCDIPATVTTLAEGGSGAGLLPTGTRELKPYVGPFPPSGTHTYRIRLHALDIDRLPVPDAAKLDEFQRGTEGHTLATADLAGTFRARRG